MATNGGKERAPKRMKGFKQDKQTGWVPVADLAPWERNPNRHPEEQLEQLREQFRRYGYVDPAVVVWIEEEGVHELRAGHGRVEALLSILQTEPDFIPRHAPGAGLIRATTVSFKTRAEADAYGLANNRLQRGSVLDDGLEAEILRSLHAAEMDLEGLGWEADELEGLLGGDLITVGEHQRSAGEADETYSRKIQTPIYEPTAEKPPEVGELFSQERAVDLIREIDATEGLPQEVADFLRAAAYRHTKFHFGRIAEFYAHASKDVQQLMERSALVIIDFEQAIELGFVRMTERLGKLADLEQERLEDEDA